LDWRREREERRRDEIKDDGVGVHVSGLFDDEC
jgi:hypothetical protein